MPARIEGGEVMRILWVSNHPAMSTAFGQQTALWLPRLRTAGHEVALFAFAGCEGAVSRLSDGTLVFPRLRDPYGNDAVQGHAEYFNADLVLTLVDPHVLDPEVYAKLPWCAWAPIDATPCPPNTARSLRAARWIWTPARFGQQQVRAAGMDAAYVPHGVDGRAFRPLDRAAARRVVEQATGAKLDGKFLVAMNAANTSQPSRKGFYEAFAAFRMFSDAHPDSALYVHAERHGAFGGEDLPQVAALVGLDPGEIVYPPQYQLVCGMLGPAYLAAVYNAADVFVLPSMGEGFGIPIVEAQACGCPVIVGDWTAMGELCFSGWKLDKVKEADPWWTPLAAYQYQPRVGPIVDRLERAYLAKGRQKFRQQAVEGAMSYDVDLVTENYWRPALFDIFQEINKPDVMPTMQLVKFG